MKLGLAVVEELCECSPLDSRLEAMNYESDLVA